MWPWSNYSPLCASVFLSTKWGQRIITPPNHCGEDEMREHMKSLNPAVPQFPQMPNGDDPGAYLVGGGSVRIKWARDRVSAVQWVWWAHEPPQRLFSKAHAHGIIIIFLLPLIQCISYLRLWYNDLHIPTCLTLCFLRNWQFWISPLPSTPYRPVCLLWFFY